MTKTEIAFCDHTVGFLSKVRLMQSLPTISSGLAQMLRWITLAPVLLPYLDAGRDPESALLC